MECSSGTQWVTQQLPLTVLVGDHELERELVAHFGRRDLAAFMIGNHDGHVRWRHDSLVQCGTVQHIRKALLAVERQHVVDSLVGQVVMALNVEAEVGRGHDQVMVLNHELILETSRRRLLNAKSQDYPSLAISRLITLTSQDKSLYCMPSSMVIVFLTSLTQLFGLVLSYTLPWNIRFVLITVLISAAPQNMLTNSTNCVKYRLMESLSNYHRSMKRAHRLRHQGPRSTLR